MVLTSILIFIVASIVAMQMDVQKNQWLIGALMYGLVSFWGFDWPWSLAVAYYTLIALFYLFSKYTHWTQWVSHLFYQNLAHFVPKLSPTEEQALQSGDAWLEEMIFVGDIQWDKLQQAHTELTSEEKQFIAEKVHTLCSLVDDWQISCCLVQASFDHQALAEMI